jgi:hypothetical protein
MSDLTIKNSGIKDYTGDMGIYDGYNCIMVIKLG